MATTRRIVVTGLSELRRGRGPRGEWILRKVEAADANSRQPITERLVSFERLPVDTPIEVQVERRDDPTHGPSFTLRRPPKAGGVLAGRVGDLERRVAALEAHAGVGGSVHAPQAIEQRQARSTVTAGAV